MAMAGAKNEAATKTAAARIRDNQRRSRARRKDYVESLQQKLHEYEKRGVGATLDMQQAARNVAMENSKLRALLARHGISTEEVDVFMRNYQGQDEASETGSAVLDGIVAQHQRQQQEHHHQSSQHEQPHQHPVPQHHQQHQHHQHHYQSSRGMSQDAPSLPPPRKQVPILAAQPAPASPYANVNTPKNQDTKFEPVRDDRNHYPTPISAGTLQYHSSSLTSPRSVPPALQGMSHHVDKLAVLASASIQQGCCEGKTQCTISSTDGSEAPSPSTVGPSPAAITPASSYMNPLSPPEQNSTSPTEMSCNTAAQIIAEMHGSSDPDVVMASLGCKGRSECQVKNTVLFHILERDGNS